MRARYAGHCSLLFVCAVMTTCLRGLLQINGLHTEHQLHVGPLFLCYDKLQVVQYAALLGPWPSSPPANPPDPPSLSSQPGTAAPPLAMSSYATFTAAGGPRNSSWQVQHGSFMQPPEQLQANRSSNTLDVQNLDFYRSVLYPTSYTILRVPPSSEHPLLTSTSSNSSRLLLSNLQAGAAKDVDPAALPPMLIVWYWMGLQSVQPGVLWLLAAAVAVVLNVLQHLPEQQWQQHQQLAESAADSLAFQAPASEAQLPWGLLQGPALTAGTAVAGQQSLLTAALQNAGSSSGSSSARAATAQRQVASHQQQCPQDDQPQESQGEQLQLFQPMLYGCQGCWTWLDWCRFILLKHALDIVLVCIKRVNCLSYTAAFAACPLLFLFLLLFSTQQ